MCVLSVSLCISVIRVGLIYISPIYIIDIYPIFLFKNIKYFRKMFLIWHIGTMFRFSVHVLLAYDLCRQHFLSVGQFLSDFTRVLHLICKAHTHTHTHILLFGSKFHTILVMYVQMINVYMEKNSKKSKISKNIEKSDIFDILKISQYFPTLCLLLWVFISIYIM